MKYFLSLILMFVCASKGIQAQNITPANIKTSVIESAIILPKQDNKTLLMNELTLHESGRAIKFAQAFSSNHTVFNAGIWDTSRSELDVWRLMIKSEGALSINLGFENFHLPADTELYIYDDEQSYMLGPFTEEDNDVHGQFWTPIIKGDIVILELRIPKNKKEELVLELTKINHDYMGFGKSFSGSCNLDVVCGEFDGYEMVEEFRDIIQSVGAYHIGGTETCSGALINNARQDQTPYFLTADHCGISQNNAASVVAYWNYESSYCRIPGSAESGADGDGVLNQFNSGAFYRSGSGASDFNLIEFDDPIKTEFKPFYAGWKNDFVSSSTVIGIHHPGVEEKRISFEFDMVVDGDGNYIDVNDWDIGTTEGGSSGSPLFNPEKQIIGQLFGGLAACSNDLYDTYGSINASWLGDGTPETSLKPWLDPDDTGLTELDGYNGSYGLILAEGVFRICTKDMDELTLSFEVQEAFTDFVNIEFQNLPNGLVVSSIDENITPGGAGQAVLQNLSSVSDGEYFLSVVSTDGENVAQNIVVLIISSDAPTQALAISPENQIDDAQISQEFFWMAIDNAISYDIEFSFNDSFTDLYTSVNDLEDNEYLAQSLGNTTQYFWRVRGTNLCGPGEWSETFSFTTSESYCITVSANDLPVLISEIGQSENTSSIFVDYPIILDKLNVPNLTIEHTYLEDLIINVSNPENDDQVQLMDQQCGFESNINAGFDDLGIENLPCPPVDSRVYAPKTPFRNLTGINAQGKWDLTVFDNFNADGGQILAWNLELCFSKTEGTSLIPLDPEGTVVCTGQENTLSYYYSNESTQTEILSLQTASGESIQYSTMSPSPNDGSGSIEIQIAAEGPLVPGINEIYLSFGSGMEARSMIFVESAPEFGSINGIQSGETISSLEDISWTASNADSYNINIATDSEFVDIIWSTTVEGDVNSIEGPSLDDGEYYLLIEAVNNCGTISSDLYNFMIDESVSIKESATASLYVAQNVTEKTIILSGNTAQKELQISLISVSGHKLLSQSTHEESLHVNASAIFPGVYFLQIKSGLDSTIRKIVIY